MKRTIYNISVLLFLILATIGCREKDLNESGLLRLSIGIKDKVETVTRTLSDEEQNALKGNAKIRIYSGKGLVRKYNGTAEMPAEMQLAAGDYNIKVAAGDSVAASFDKTFYRGEKDFSIHAGQSSSVSVECIIANTLVTVEFAKSLTQAFQSYEVQVASSAGSLTFTSDTPNAIGYYMIPADDAQLSWTFKATTLSGNEYTRTNTLTVAPTTRYDLTFGYEDSGESYDDGGSTLTLDINTEPLETSTVEVPVYRRPSITGKNFGNENELFVELNKGTEQEFWIATSSILTKALVSCDQFTSLGLPVNSFDILAMNAEDKSLFSSYGVNIVSKYNVNTGQGNTKIGLSEAFMQKLSQKEGVYDIQINATDDNKLQRSSVFRFIVSDAIVVTTNVIDAEVWATKATIRASLAKETEEALAFKYRIKGTTGEFTVPAQRVNGSKLLYANIKNLAPGTTYEYWALAGASPSTIISQFTTETTTQLENAGFEYWTDGTPMLVFGSGQSMWWDSGNHGSATASINITTYSTEYKNSGNFSAKLQSKKAGMMGVYQFAAGNLFAGKYIATEMSGVRGNGVLGWGRPFSSRPVALKGYIRYEPKAVDMTNNCSYINAGDMDKGCIYIALGDWVGETANGETWPVIVKTNFKDGNSAKLFNPNDIHIIAYGEKTWDEATAGDGMVEFEIPIEYRNMDTKPTSIVLVASSSKYGDYFTGGVDSTMWLDDLKLVYE